MYSTNLKAISHTGHGRGRLPAEELQMSQTIGTTATQIGAAPRRALATLASKSLLVTLTLAALGMTGYAGAAGAAMTNRDLLASVASARRGAAPIWVAVVSMV